MIIRHRYASLVCLLACAFPAKALAVDSYEPNNDIASASAALVDGTVYRGEVQTLANNSPTPRDKDYFRLNLPQDSQQLKVAFRFWGGTGAPQGCPQQCAAQASMVQTSGNGLYGIQPVKLDSGLVPLSVDGTFQTALAATIDQHGDYLILVEGLDSGFSGDPVTVQYELTVTRQPGINPPVPTPPSTPDTSNTARPECENAEAANTRAYKRYLTAARAYRRKHTRRRKLAKAKALSAWRTASRRLDRVC